MLLYIPCFFFFFFNDTATTEIYTLSLHDALPISRRRAIEERTALASSFSPSISLDLTTSSVSVRSTASSRRPDRKSTRLNSSHVRISYAVFCLKKKKKKTNLTE